jgi:hypothetical protein
MDRSFIIAELRRCATENGGTPLGKDRFERATGIRESDWSGRYWVRWSDLVREAGFEPQTMTASYADEHLLDQLALLISEVGHWPVRTELRLRRRTHPDFPSDKVYDRFGQHEDLIGRVLTYAEEGGYEDVAAICRSVLASRPSAQARTAPPDTSVGFVYLMKSGKHFKIGHSKSVGRRQYDLAIQLPERLTLIHSFETDDPEGIERYWHDRFASKRLNGEWFALTSDDVAAFKRRKRFM